MKTSKFIWLSVLAIVGVFVIAWGFYALSVAMSGPKGVGDAIKQKNSASNWTAAQAEFEKRYQEIIFLDKQIGVNRAALEKSPDDVVLQTNVTGVTSGCMSAVADYNADSRSYLKEEFKSVDLPFQIDDYDPKTDCK